MLPKETSNLDRLRVKLYFYIDQFYLQGIRTTHRMTNKFKENFK